MELIEETERYANKISRVTRYNENYYFLTGKSVCLCASAIAVIIVSGWEGVMSIKGVDTALVWGLTACPCSL